MNLKLKKSKSFSIAISLITLAIILIGCRGDEVSPTPTPDVFKPPTPAPSPSPTPAQLQSPTPSSAETCHNYLVFVADLTIPDGSEAAPGERLVKQWRVENTGECNWSAGYTVQLISGPDLGASRTQALYPARRKAKAILQITFTAPQEPGTYTSMWQAFDPQGMPFGEAFYIEIVVEEE